MTTEKRPVGRPTVYTDELADEICSRLSEGESLRGICNDAHIPNRQTILNWMRSKPDFSAKCAYARDGQADWLHDDMADIETKVLEGTLDPQAARVVLSSKQWRAAKLAPKKYGDKVQAEISGKDGAAIEINVNDAFAQFAASLEQIARGKAVSPTEAGAMDRDGEAGTDTD